MKYLVLVLLLCALPSLSNAFCFVNPKVSGATHCQDSSDKTWHAVGSSWRNSECMDCSCSDIGSHCCQAYSTPRSFPEDCMSVFDSDACEYKVHKKDNPAVECPIFMAVGK